MNKFTPGPWRAQKPRGHQHAIDRKWEIVAPQDSGELVIVGEHTGIDCLNQANALLIAAAPDLFAALQDVVEQLQHYLLSADDDYDAESAYQHGCAVLAKVVQS